VKLVGLKGYSRYSDRKAFSLEEINKMKEVAVALNRIKEGDEIVEVCKKIKHEHIVLNELYAIANASKFKKVTVSVGMNALNNEDLKFFEKLGVYAVVLPPELNDELKDFKNENVKIEAFARAFVEMFYKGKCYISSYFSGKSVKKSGECKMECARKWDVFYAGKKILEVTFRPELRYYDINADLVKHEKRQIDGVGVIENGTNNRNSQS